MLEHDWGVLADAMRREIARGGQVYYLHNRIENITSCAAAIQTRIPEARITVAHGSSRADIDAHHHGAASRVSNGLMEAEALAAIFARHLRVTEVISTDEMYQVVGEKE